MVETYSFGYWVLRRRKALDWTRDELASRVGCATETIKKIERDERRPSRQVAELLAKALDVPPEERALFLQVARSERSVDRLGPVSMPFAPIPARLHNLPVSSTSFIGRQEEIAGLRARLEEPQVRLLTITGPGGIGKTRLALQVASQLVGAYPGGVWLVELSGLSNPALVPQEILTSLGVLEQPKREFSEILVEFLRSHPRLLLVLDNCEHVLEACADLSNQLLKHCPNLQVLATSRQALGVSGEAIWPVTGLSLLRMPEATEPTEDQALDPGALIKQSEAMRLFVERAHLVQPHFHLTKRDVLAVAQICQDLDGMPLAIELAAARVKFLSVQQISGYMDDALRLLAGGSRSAPSRQQTLRATMDWSYNLLVLTEQALLRRLAVFAGSFNLEDVEKVCSGEGIPPPEVLDLLSRLVDKSLILVDRNRAEAGWYLLLEPIRQYALGKLNDSGEHDFWRDRHLAWYLALAEQADPHFYGPHPASWVERIRVEYPNLRAAFQWSHAKASRTESGLRLALALTQFWQMVGYFSEGLEWLSPALIADSDIPASVRANALFGASFLAVHMRNFEDARYFSDKALAIYEETGSQEGIAKINRLVGWATYSEGELEKAWTYARQSLEMQRKIGNRWELAAVLLLCADLAYMQGNYVEAKTRIEESLSLCLQIGNRLAWNRRLTRLGQICLAQGDALSAKTRFEESLSAGLEIGDKWGLAMALAGMASLAGSEAQMRRAARLLGATSVLLAGFNTQLWPLDQAEYDRNTAMVKAALGEAAYASAWNEGCAAATSSLEQAVALAFADLEPHETVPNQDPPS